MNEATETTSQGKSKQQRVDNHDLDGSKNPKKQPQDTSSSTATKEKVIEILDVAETIGLKPGTRVEVRWDLSFDDNEKVDINDNNIDNDKKDADTGEQNDNSTTQRSETRWWGGTLLPDDGRTFTINNDNDEVTVPLRSIDYDPYLPSFPDRSIEDVCFLSPHFLLNVSSDSRSCWRLEGDTWEPSEEDEDEDNGETFIFDSIPNTERGSSEGDIDDEISVASASQEDGLREVLDTILRNALQTSGVMEKMKSLEPSLQSTMAEKIATTKDKLVEKMLAKLNNDGANNQGNGIDNVITPELVKSVMSELGNELRTTL